MPIFILKNGGDTLTGSSGNDTITGGTGNDQIYSGDGADLIDGGDGNDQINGLPTTGGAYVYVTYSGSKTINGGNGDDFIYGADGADSLVGGSGNDSIYGSIGNDILDGSLGNDYLSGGTGNDSLIGNFGNDTVYGGDGSDTIIGGDGDDSDLDGGTGNDSISGGIGNDSLWGQAGDDTLDGGLGNDDLSAGSGNDLFLAGAGDDIINKLNEAGNDTVYGGDGNDLVNFNNDEGIKLIYGESGNDSLYGGNANDSIEGGVGDDSIKGNLGNDYISGSEGNDTIYGGTGDDSILGGSGNDNLWGDEGNDTLDGGDGNDSLRGWTGNDIYSGGEGDDYIYDSEGDNSINVGNGNDTVLGGIGNDLITGGAGNDNLDGYSGNDTIDGGDGNNYIYSGDGVDLITTGSGNDNINGNLKDVNNPNGAYTFFTYSGAKNIASGLGNDFIYGGTDADSISSGGGNDVVYGSSGNDSIDGGSGSDNLNGNDGNDSIDGGDGNDELYGGTGNDSLIGGDGNDYLSDSGGNNYFDAGNGNDTVYGDSGNDTVIGGNGNDSVIGWSGNDSLLGGDGDDTLSGGDGNDTIDGGVGNNYIFSGDGVDLITSGTGNDNINGRLKDVNSPNGAYTYFSYSGAKTISSGLGNDFIFGGTDADTISSGDGNDVVYGSSGNDSIDGGSGTDILNGDDGNDTIDGGIGNDSIYGGDGNDVINGGLGNDSLLGADGNDIYYVDSTFDYIYDSGGTDTAYVSASFVKIPSSIEKVNYVNGAQALPYWIDALLPDEAVGKHYTTLLGDAQVFGYIFPTVIPSYDTSADHAKGYTAFTAVQQNRTVVALSYISSVLDLQFSKVTSPAALNTLTFASNNQADSGGYALYPNTDFSGSDLFLNIADYNTTLADGTFGTYTLMHELGHALGLKHPFDEKDASGNVDVPPYLQGSEDSTTWTYISYNYSSSEYYLRYSPLDIAALQYLYGPSKTSRAGNDTYKISTSTPNFVWDGAGLDAIDAGSVTQAATIYLTPGYQGYLGTTKAEKITTAGQITVNFGTVIENLIGSNYDDHLYGNQVGNKIEGGIGSDSIEGWDGDDTLLGGVGNDYLTGSSGNDSIEGGDGNDTLVVTGPATNYTIRYDSSTQNYSIEAKSGAEGKDTFKSIEFLKFSDKTLAIQSVDLTPPTIAITSDLNSLGIGKTSTVTFTLSEASTTFTASDVTVSGGTLTNFKGSGSTYTATFIPTVDSIANGVVSVASDVFSDLAGNSNADGSDSNNKLTLAIDTVTPVIALSTNKPSLISGESATLTFTLSEASTTFTASDVTVSGGTLTNFKGTEKSYSATFTPTANSTINGVISIRSGVFADGAGNLNADGSDANNAITFAIDTVVPEIALSSAKSSLIAGDTTTLAFTLSKASTTFTAADITVSGGSLSNFTGSGRIYTALFTPKNNSTTNGVISVASGVFSDLSGNTNTDGSDTNNKLTLSIDTLPPTFSIVSEQQFVDEGNIASFRLTTTKIAVGTQINYSIGGVSSQDISGNSLQGTVLVGTNGVTQILVQLLADFQTEGPETLTVSVEGQSASTLINDTSINKGPAASDLVYVFKSEKVGPGVLPGSYSYYYTSNPEEAAYINAQAHWPWVQKASTFEAAHSMPALSTPVFRFWSDTLQAPYFTISEAERDQIILWSSTRKNGYDWQYAGTGFSVYTSSAPTDALGKSAIPVYCIWMDDTDFNPANGMSGGLLFTADKVEYDGLVKLVGVTGAGVVFYGEVPGN